MRSLIPLFGVIACTPLVSAGDDPLPLEPSVKLDKEVIEWTLPASHASSAWHFFEKAPACVKYDSRRRIKVRADPPLVDVTSITSQGIDFLRQVGSDLSLSRTFYDDTRLVVAGTIPITEVGVFTLDVANQAMTNLIAWMATSMPVEINYVLPEYIPTHAYFVVATLIIGCFQRGRSEVLLRNFKSTNKRDSKYSYKDFCKDVPPELEPLCDFVLCQGENGVCTDDYMKGCACQVPQNCRKFLVPATLGDR